ncbi:MAG: hydrogenase maturation nickel metallochaperone HypA [Cyclobacteriaceae bacterium]|nr:hydrogenase maturation nickel metallochaperone HypA [Cyclobacteriaceae bacterium]
MHELSIALGIVKIAENERQKANAQKIDRIELEIGALSGVELESLDFVWSMAVKDTALERAIYEVEYIKGKAECLECGQAYSIKNLFDNCPTCKGYFKNVVAGKELRVKALEVS